MERTEITLYACSALLGSIAYHAAPYVPDAIDRLQEFFTGPIVRISDLEPPDSYRVTGSKPLFRRIEDAEIYEAEEQLARAARGEPASTG